MGVSVKSIHWCIFICTCITIQNAMAEKYIFWKQYELKNLRWLSHFSSFRSILRCLLWEEKSHNPGNKEQYQPRVQWAHYGLPQEARWGHHCWGQSGIVFQVPVHNKFETY